MRNSRMHAPTVLVVDDEAPVRGLIEQICSTEGFQVVSVADGPTGIQAVKDMPVQAVVTDLKLPGMDGFEVMERVAQINPKILTIVMSGQGTIDDAVRVMKAGAFDFITKPFTCDSLRLTLRKASDHQRLRQGEDQSPHPPRDHYRSDRLVGTSEAIGSILAFIEKVADSDSTILIQGDSGTGKEMVARMLHANSSRRERPFVPVNCAAIPESLLESELFGHEKGAFTGAAHTRTGRFEMAHGGTILLDEVAELPLPLQVKLLRVLQERAFERVGGTKTIAVDVRVIAATNQDLEQALQAGRFRTDLYYRLNVIPLTLPPLRDRRSDIPLLVDHFVQRFNVAKQAAICGVAPDAMSHLMRYGWPGNVRELENLLERMVVLKKTGQIETADLPDKILQSVVSPAVRQPVMTAQIGESGVNLVQELEQYENHLIRVALRQANGITSKAAQLLHLNRTTLVEKLKRKKLDARMHAGDPFPQ